MTVRLQELGIPEEFEALSHTIKVVEYARMPDVGKYGDWDHSSNEIRLFTKGVCDSVVVHTYYHELVHCLFDMAGRSDCSGDETLVDTVGGLLAQVVKTSK